MGLGSLSILLMGVVGAWASSLDALQSLRDGLDSIREFRELRLRLKEMRVAGWLFGGTAFSYGRFQLSLRADGSSRQRPIGDIPIWNVFQPTQDLDIVIDGTELEAQAFERWLMEKFPYRLPSFLGGKSMWEVRLLRSEREHKMPLFENVQFTQIHSDSGSTGLIQIFHPEPNEPRTRDLHHWQLGDNSPFLRTLIDNHLRYHYAADHRKSLRYQKGKNPEIFSVIRYLTKLFQEKMAIDEPALENYLIPMINAFRDETVLNPEYGRDRLRRLVAKMFLQATNLEEAVTFCKQIGFTDRLLRTLSDVRAGSPTWWLSRKPLNHSPLASSHVRALAVYFLEVDEYWELLRLVFRRDDGIVNVFSKPFRDEPSGRTWWGVMGRERPAPNGKIPVQFSLRPESREGIDYLVIPGGIFLLNGAAAQIGSPHEQLSLEQILSGRVRFRLGALDHHDSNISAWEYLGKNASQMLDWLGEDLLAFSKIPVLCVYAEEITEALRKGVISHRDYRRLLARVLGLSEPSEEFLRAFRNVMQKYPEIETTFQERRRVFVNSTQSDAVQVRQTFLLLEKSEKSCGALLEKSA